MLDLHVPDPPTEVLRRLADFGADWHESKIPAELRRAGIIGVAVRVQADQFRMTIRAARRSPNLQLRGVVAATPEGGSRVSGGVRLSAANQLMQFAFLVVAGGMFWQSFGFVGAALASLVLIGAIAGLSAVGTKLGEREYEALLEHAARSHRDPAT